MIIIIIIITPTVYYNHKINKIVAESIYLTNKNQNTYK